MAMESYRHLNGANVSASSASDSNQAEPLVRGVLLDLPELRFCFCEGPRGAPCSAPLPLHFPLAGARRAVATLMTA